MKSRRFTAVLLAIYVLLAVSSCTSRKIDLQLRRAEELIGTRHFNEAVQIYKLVITRYPKNRKTAVAGLKLGDLYFYTFNNNKEALTAYSLVVERWPFSAQAWQSAVRKAEIYEVEGHFRKAIAELEWAARHFPEHDGRFKIKLKIAENYLALNDPYQASVELEELLESVGVDINVHSKAQFDLGESYLSLKEYEKALTSFNKIVEKFPDAPYILDAQLRRVECLEELNRPEEAIKLQEELVRQNPESEIVRRKVEGLIRREEKIEKPDDSGMPAPAELKELKILRGDKLIAGLKVEISRTPEELAKGLMFREKLPDGQGMYFIFDSDTQNPFWMENTLIGLDIIFIDNQNKICSITRNAQPLSRGKIYPAKPYRYVLEVPAGYAAGHSLKTGDRIVLEK